MQKHLYHGRRLALSFVYEYLLRIISIAFAIKPCFYLVPLFGLATMACGIAFTVEPAAMAGFFGFENLNLIALSDVRAYYGTMLIGLGITLCVLAQNDERARAALLIIIAFSLGSAAGRFMGLVQGVPLLSIHGVLLPIEVAVSWLAYKVYSYSLKPENPEPLPMLNPEKPEDFRPLTAKNFTNPYAYYKMLRDDYPVYKMPGEDYYLISRYQDIVDLAKQTESLSNKLVEIIATGKPKDPNKKGLSPIERLGEWGIIPVDVFALQDPPIHTAERKIGHAGFNAKFVKSLEPEVEQLCDEMMNEFIPQGSVEFVQHFAWRLPMRLIMRLLALPEDDYEQIKDWCVAGIRSLSGTCSKAEMIAVGCSGAQFMRYVWHHYLRIKVNPESVPQTCFTRTLAKMSDDAESVMTDQRAVATIFQLLIAGSDSSASTMGAAVRILAANADIEQFLRDNPDKIDAFIEEVFRTESAFQGHFRLTTQPIALHGQTLPANTRLFLMWGSGNRDERYWDEPDVFVIDRKNGKKHLTFGHGIHACLGRELARMEIRIVIKQLLARTERLAVVGETAYEASIFARTLLALPLAFEAKAI